MQRMILEVSADSRTAFDEAHLALLRASPFFFRAWKSKSYSGGSENNRTSTPRFASMSKWRRLSDAVAIGKVRFLADRPYQGCSKAVASRTPLRMSLALVSTCQSTSDNAVVATLREGPAIGPRTGRGA